MRCRLKYCHPVTGNQYYYVGLRLVDNVYKPVGCHMYRKLHSALFDTKRDALKVADYLKSLGYLRVTVV